MKRYVCRQLYYRFAYYLQASSKKPFGGISKKIRYFLCRRIFRYCGSNVNIESHASFGAGDKIEIGDNSGIGVNCTVPNCSIIGKNVMMGPNMHVLERNHSFESKDVPMMFQGYSDSKEFRVEDDVWIGRDVLATPGRTIKRGSIIAAGCVLCKDFPEFSVIGGNPSRLIKTR